MTKQIATINMSKLIYVFILLVLSSCDGEYKKKNDNQSKVLEIIKIEKLAKNAYNSDDYSSALYYYLKLSELDSLNPNYLIRIAKLESLQQNETASIKYFDRVLEMNPKDSIALIGISTVYAKLLDDSMGSFYIDRYLAIYPLCESGQILKQTFNMMKQYRKNEIH